MRGTKYGLDRTYYWEQTRNGVEYIIRAIKTELTESLMRLGIKKDIIEAAHLQGFLESCGADSVVNACANLMGPDLPGVKTLEKVFPGYAPQLDDITMLCFADSRNLEEWKKYVLGFDGTTVMENRVMDLHVAVARMMFGIHAEKHTGRTFDDIYHTVSDGDSVGIHLPGHYVSAGIIDDETGDLRIKDSWGGRKPEWNGDGFLQVLDREEFKTVKEIVVYHKPSI